MQSKILHPDLLLFMHTIAWWPSLAVLIAASGIDLWTRRIPNWLVVPFLAAGLAAHSFTRGLPGAGQSLAGMGVAVLLFGLPCVLGGRGMGDLKLAAGVGAWVGPDQMFLAFVMAGMIGGVFAVFYALWQGRLGSSMDSTAELLAHFAKGRLRPHDRIQLGSERSISIPYAPVIAAGALLSFLAI